MSIFLLDLWEVRFSDFLLSDLEASLDYGVYAVQRVISRVSSLSSIEHFKFVELFDYELK